MKHVGVVLLALAMLGSYGCGSSRGEIDQLRADEKRRTAELQQQVRALSEQVRQLQQNFHSLDGDMFELKGQLDEATVGGGVTGAGGAGHGLLSGSVVLPAADGASSGSAGLVGDEVEPIEAGSLEDLASEVSKIQAEVVRLRQQFVRKQELATLLDPRKISESLTDPEKLTLRVDRFSNVWSDKITDETTRQAFVADIEELKRRTQSRGAMSKDELAAHYRASLTARADAEDNERIKKWFKTQLVSLNSTREGVVEAQVSTLLRYDSIQDLRDLARKYSISEKDMRRNGLQITGVVRHWRPTSSF